MKKHRLVEPQAAQVQRSGGGREPGSWSLGGPRMALRDGGCSLRVPVGLKDVGRDLARTASQKQPREGINGAGFRELPIHGTTAPV